MCGGWTFGGGMPFMWMGGSFWLLILIIGIAVGALLFRNRNHNS
ncbi:hypothetical protein RA086_10405 [Lactiplantibacillus sp. WILCCON 0030]|uniref:LPXTG cell wall anchor domain-containing protein n=1 Tax=Lactiplantibacillus brownii TaxID=3069269 RepID=A0ABU1AAT3_9LACO|nr:hypothetical protein [Lactiplantibacillus brownii]MDQ7938020.1 hypothetical protein [Lactiplantibacillus brownii]